MHANGMNKPRMAKVPENSQKSCHNPYTQTSYVSSQRIFQTFTKIVQKRVNQPVYVIFQTAAVM